MKEAYYFSHDYNSRNDRLMVKLLMKKGVAGIGIYWCIVEMLYEENGYLLRSEYERISFELREEIDSIKFIIECSELFQFDDDKFWSESVLRRLNIRNEKSEKARKSVKSRWNKYERNTNVIREDIKRNTLNEKKRNIYIAPSLSEFIEYFKLNNFPSELAERAFNGYSEANWHDSKDNPIKNWKQKCQHVWFKPENKVKIETISKKRPNQIMEQIGELENGR